MCWVVAALSYHGCSRGIAEHDERIVFLVGPLRPGRGFRFCQLPQPLRPRLLLIDALAATGNRAGTIERLEPIHDPGIVFHECTITAVVLFEPACCMVTVLHRRCYAPARRLLQLVAIDRISVV